MLSSLQHPPKEAFESRRAKANDTLEGEYYHAPANNPANKQNKGYRPGRASVRKRRES